MYAYSAEQLPNKTRHAAGFHAVSLLHKISLGAGSRDAIDYGARDLRIVPIAVGDIDLHLPKDGILVACYPNTLKRLPNLKLPKAKS